MLVAARAAHRRGHGARPRHAARLRLGLRRRWPSQIGAAAGLRATAHGGTIALALVRAPRAPPAFLDGDARRADAARAGRGLGRAGRRRCYSVDGRSSIPAVLHHLARRSSCWPTPALLRPTWPGAIRAGWTAASSRACAGRSRLAVAFVPRALAVLSPPLRPAAYNVPAGRWPSSSRLQGLAVVALLRPAAGRAAAPARGGAGAGARQPLGAADPGPPRACSTSGSISASGPSPRAARRSRRSQVALR